MVRQDKNKSGRVTPKGTEPEVSTSTVSREPVKVRTPASRFVGPLMFTLMGLGTLMILFNYIVEVDALGTPSNWYLLGGLGLVLGGIIAATQYH